MQWPARSLAAAEPFGRRKPGRMRRAVRVAEAGDGLRGNLDLAGRRFQRMKLRIPAKIVKQHKIFVGQRQFDKAVGPERVEVRQRDILPGGAGAHLFIDPAAPRHLVAAFGEGIFVAEAHGEGAENLEVAFRFSLRRDGAMHGEHVGIAGRAADIVAFQCGRRRQHDIGMTRCWRPPAVVDDNGLRLLPGLAQAVEVLMMMEGIAAGPVDQADVGIASATAVEFIGAAGLRQHVGDAGHRNGAVGRIGWRRDFRPRKIRARHADAVERAMAESKAAAGQADSAEHGGKCDRRPVGLFAVVGALQRPRAGDQAAGARGASREIADAVRIDAADRRGPVRILRRRIVFAQQITLQRVETGAAAIQKFPIVPLLDQQGVRKREHQRGVGVGTDREPLGAEKVWRIRASRADHDKVDAGGLGAREPGFQHVRAHASRRHLAVLKAQSAECDYQAGVLDHRIPVGDAAGDRLVGADDMRQQKLCRAPAVVSDLVDAAAAEEQESAHQRPRMVQPSRRRPAVGAAENRGVAVCAAHPRQFAGDKIEHFVPAGFAEAVGAAARPPLAPAFADRRLCSPQRRVKHLRDSGEHRRGRRVALERFASDHPIVLDQRAERAPVSQRRCSGYGH